MSFARLTPALSKQLRIDALKAQIEMAYKKGHLSVVPYLKSQIDAIENEE